jgi:hypothetical protein
MERWEELRVIPQGTSTQAIPTQETTDTRPRRYDSTTYEKEKTYLDIPLQAMKEAQHKYELPPVPTHNMNTAGQVTPKALVYAQGGKGDLRKEWRYYPEDDNMEIQMEAWKKDLTDEGIEPDIQMEGGASSSSRVELKPRQTRQKGGWQRDLTQEGIEKNPGPYTLPLWPEATETEIQERKRETAIPPTYPTNTWRHWITFIAAEA